MPTHRQVLRIPCPAKINLALSVGAPTPKNPGLHPIASWMLALNLADELTLRPAAAGPSRFDIRFHPTRPRDVDWPIESDLAVRAHALLQRHTGRELPVDARLVKRIPAGAGLGGGSADAAAMLVGLDRLFELALDAETLVDLATRLGSDVAFAVCVQRGNPAAIVTGAGRCIEPLPTAAPLDLLLILPDFGCPTAAVYKAFDDALAHRSAEPAKPDVDRVRRLARTSPLPPDAPFNDLAEPACRVRPELADLRRRIARTLDRPVHVTGSGSTLFALTPDTDTARNWARRIRDAHRLDALPTQTRT